MTCGQNFTLVTWESAVNVDAFLGVHSLAVPSTVDLVKPRPLASDFMNVDQGVQSWLSLNLQRS
jgi:hypothetical protein